MSNILQLVINGINSSSLILMAALGLAIICGLMNVINLAHGELIMIGAYTSFYTTTVLHAPFFIGMIAAFVFTGIVGMLLEIILIKKLYSRPSETLLATFGISIILQQLVRLLCGPDLKHIAVPFDGQLSFGNLIIPVYNIFTVLVVILVLLLTAVLFFKTAFGKKLRAITQNRNMTECLGIDTSRIDTWTFAYGSALAGLAGAMLSPVRSVSPFMGSAYMVDSFMTVVVGGVNSIFGTAVGSAMVGESVAVLGGLGNEITAKVLVFIFIIIIIRFKPEGLFARERR